MRQRTNNTGAAPIGSPLTIPLSIPAGAIVLSPPPVLFGSANAAHLGMTPELARRTLATMERDRAFAGAVVVLSRRPRELAAAPEDVLRFLRTRQAVRLDDAAANDAGAPPDPDSADAVLAEMGLPTSRPRRAGGGR